MKQCDDCGAFNPLRFDFDNSPISGNCAHTGEYVVAKQNCKIELEESKINEFCASCRIE